MPNAIQSNAMPTAGVQGLLDVGLTPGATGRQGKPGAPIKLTDEFAALLAALTGAPLGQMFQQAIVQPPVPASPANATASDPMDSLLLTVKRQVMSTDSLNLQSGVNDIAGPLKDLLAQLQLGSGEATSPQPLTTEQKVLLEQGLAKLLTEIGVPVGEEISKADVQKLVEALAPDQASHLHVATAEPEKAMHPHQQAAVKDEAAQLDIAQFEQVNGQMMTKQPQVSLGNAEKPAALAFPQALRPDQVMAAVGESVRNVKPGKYEVTLRLSPESLGDVQLRLVVEGKEVRTIMQVTNPQAKQMLEQYTQQLRDSLNQAGLALAGFTVNTGAGNGQQQRQLKEQFEAIMEDRRLFGSKTSTDAPSTEPTRSVTTASRVLPGGYSRPTSNRLGTIA